MSVLRSILTLLYRAWRWVSPTDAAAAPYPSEAGEWQEAVALEKQKDDMDELVREARDIVKKPT